MSSPCSANAPATAAFLVAALETVIGLGLITGVFMRVTLLLLALQMIGTVMPIFLFPDRVFQIVPFVPTLEGQYIIKNMVLISAGLVIGATVRGGRLVAALLTCDSPAVDAALGGLSREAREQISADLTAHLTGDTTKTASAS